MKTEKKKTPKKESKKEKNTDNSFIQAVLKGTGIGLGITCIVFVACALILTYTDVDESHIGIVSTICTAVSALASGFIWARAARKKGLLIGALAGLVYGIIILIISLIAGGGPLAMGSLTCLVIAAAGGGIGGILGVNTK
ncbi:hypothetical protein IMSAG049_01456 [Clostridiales bacterium]|nr:hypothetical protein IMSAG049_01456 [Clostridiales bacterium]